MYIYNIYVYMLYVYREIDRLDRLYICAAFRQAYPFLWVDGWMIPEIPLWWGAECCKMIDAFTGGYLCYLKTVLFLRYLQTNSFSFHKNYSWKSCWKNIIWVPTLFIWYQNCSECDTNIYLYKGNNSFQWFQEEGPSLDIPPLFLSLSIYMFISKFIYK